MQNIRNHLHLIWADKIVLWLAVLFVAMVAVGWMLVALAAGTLGANHVVASIGFNGGPIVIALASFWALLRAIDFIAKGSTYRMFTAPPEPPAANIAHGPATNPGKPMAAL